MVTELDIPKSVSKIGKYTFSRCGSVTEVSIPETVSEIGDGSFYECVNMTSISLPASVQYIGEGAFMYCNALESVYYPANNPIKGSVSIFSEETYGNAILYLTEEGVTSGSSINPWKRFKHIETYYPDNAVETIDGIEIDAPYEVFSTKGVRIGDSVEGLTPGIYIVRQGNKAIKVAVK